MSVDVNGAPTSSCRPLDVPGVVMFAARTDAPTRLSKAPPLTDHAAAFSASDTLPFGKLPPPAYRYTAPTLRWEADKAQLSDSKGEDTMKSSMKSPVTSPNVRVQPKREPCTPLVSTVIALEIADENKESPATMEFIGSNATVPALSLDVGTLIASTSLSASSVRAEDATLHPSLPGGNNHTRDNCFTRKSKYAQEHAAHLVGCHP
jgi:hypothetical protein